MTAHIHSKFSLIPVKTFAFTHKYYSVFFTYDTKQFTKFFEALTLKYLRIIRLHFKEDKFKIKKKIDSKL